MGYIKVIQGRGKFYVRIGRDHIGPYPSKLAAAKMAHKLIAQSVGC